MQLIELPFIDQCKRGLLDLRSGRLYPPGNSVILAHKMRELGVYVGGAGEQGAENWNCKEAAVKGGISDTNW